MTQPTDEAMRAAESIRQAQGGLGRINMLAEIIDQATGLPSLKARVAELESAVRAAELLTKEWDKIAYDGNYNGHIRIGYVNCGNELRKALSNPMEV